jgi:hypothetical protein
MKVEVEVKQTCVTRDNRLRITHISYSTTLPTEIEPAMALEIIDNYIVQPYLVQIDRRNVGKLVSFTEDKVQQRYCFSISGQPRCSDEAFTVEVDVPF